MIVAHRSVRNLKDVHGPSQGATDPTILPIVRCSFVVLLFRRYGHRIS